MKTLLLFLLLNLVEAPFINLDTTDTYTFGDKIVLNELGEINFFQVGDFKIHNDRIYIADTKKQKVYAFHKTGKLIKSSGRQGKGPGEFVNGPRLLSLSGDNVYVIGRRLFLFVYDQDMGFKRNKKISVNPLRILGAKSFDDRIFFMTSQFVKHDLIIYKPSDDKIDRVDLNLEIEPGLLGKKQLFKFGENWLLAWKFKNRFQLYDSSFKKVSSFMISDIPSQAPGEIVKSDFIPGEASAYQAKVYKRGAFYPQGTLFSSSVKIDDNHFMVQLGTSSGGSQKALVLDIKGNIKQTITLPHRDIRVLGYSDEILYMLDRKEGKISGYSFSK